MTHAPLQSIRHYCGALARNACLDERESYGRPVGVTLGPDGSVLVADDVGDVIWRVTSERQG